MKFDENSFRLAPPGAYTVLVREWEYDHTWSVMDVRLYGRSIWADYIETHQTLANQWWGDVVGRCATREEALAEGGVIAAEHRDLHAWWVPA